MGPSKHNGHSTSRIYRYEQEDLMDYGKDDACIVEHESILHVYKGDLGHLH